MLFKESLISFVLKTCGVCICTYLDLSTEKFLFPSIFLREFTDLVKGIAFPSFSASLNNLLIRSIDKNGLTPS